MQTIGITTTIPLEIILAAGHKPIDLNNLFIEAENTKDLISSAEQDGFPLNTCAWIKGIYGSVFKHKIKTVVCVTGGDCSNTLMLMDVLKYKGIKTIAFSYPIKPDKQLMIQTLNEFAAEMGTSLAEAENLRREILPLRALARNIDLMTWQTNLLSGAENHSWLVSTSDFNQDLENYFVRGQALLDEAQHRKPYNPQELRLGFIGVPPIYSAHLYDYIEQCGARVVFNEIQRQFSMPYETSSLVEQYTAYTYPYETEYRINDISAAIAERKIDGIIHYVQSFCHRAIGDILMRQSLNVPILTIEGNTDTHLNQHLKTRIEAFLDMLSFNNLYSKK